MDIFAQTAMQIPAMINTAERMAIPALPSVMLLPTVWNSLIAYNESNSNTDNRDICAITSGMAISDETPARFA